MSFDLCILRGNPKHFAGQAAAYVEQHVIGVSGSGPRRSARTGPGSS